MPTSRPNILSPLCQDIIRYQPKTILDIGIGSGSKGFLFREYTDIWNQRYSKKSWQCKIEGVEIFEPYITDIHKQIYDKIYIGNICKLINTLPEYDFIYAGDVLEHIEKEKGIVLLTELKRHAKILIITTPIIVHKQGTILGNQHEQHISQWNEKDFLGAQISKFGNAYYIKYNNNNNK